MDKAEQRRLEREKRQARIRASGSNRLAKITGLAGTEDFKAPVDMAEKEKTLEKTLENSGPSNVQTDTLTADTQKSDTQKTNTLKTNTQTTNTKTSIDSSNPSANANSLTSAETASGQDPLLEYMKQQNDPLFSMLASLAGQGGSGENSTESLFGNGQFGNGLFGAGAFGNGTMDGQASGKPEPTQAQMQNMAQAHQRSVNKTNSEYWWNLAYFLSSIFLGLYAALVNPWIVGTIFLGVQLGMFSLRFFLGHHSTGIPMISMLAPFLSMLPPHRQRQLSLAGGIISSLRLAYWNFAVVLFVYGLASRGGAEFARPI